MYTCTNNLDLNKIQFTTYLHMILGIFLGILLIICNFINFSHFEYALDFFSLTVKLTCIQGFVTITNAICILIFKSSIKLNNQHYPFLSQGLKTFRLYNFPLNG